MMKLKNIDKNKEELYVDDSRKARAILKNINWDISVRSNRAAHEMYPFDCRKHHWFPATFVPEIPFTLIEVLTLSGAVVYDPFAGIGTTYFQALLLNRRPITTDICKVAVEYTQSLFILFNPEKNFDNLKENIKKMLKDFKPSMDYTSNVPKNVMIDRLRPW